MELIEDGIPLPPRPISHRSLSWDNRRVRTKTRAVAHLLPLGFFVVAGALIAFAARVTGLPYFGTAPVVVASLGVGALATAAVGHATWRNDRTVGVTIVLAAWTIAAYLIVLGLAGLTHASAMVRLAVGGHIPPLTMFVVTGLSARRSLRGYHAASWPLFVPVALAPVGFAATFTLGHLGRGCPLLDLPGPVQTAAMSLIFVWLATLLLPPVLLILSRRGDADAD